MTGKCKAQSQIFHEFQNPLTANDHQPTKPPINICLLYRYIYIYHSSSIIIIEALMKCQEYRRHSKVTLLRKIYMKFQW
jgi:hypothetical protein